MRDLIRRLAEATAREPKRTVRKDGSWEPREGDRVFQMRAGFGGIPAQLWGEVVRKGKGLRVRVGGVHTLIGGAPVGKLYPVEGWTVEGDPLVAKRQAAVAAAVEKKAAEDRAREERLRGDQAALARDGRPLATWADVRKGDLVATVGGWKTTVRMEYRVTRVRGEAAEGVQLDPPPEHPYPVALGRAADYVLLP